jgi:hypothetical protein
MMHRLIERALARDPSLADSAKIIHAHQAERYPDRDFVQHWARLLTSPAGELRSKLTSRAPDIYRLRLSSPFALVQELVLSDVTLRKRIRRGSTSAERETFKRRRPPRPLHDDASDWASALKTCSFVLTDCRPRSRKDADRHLTAGRDAPLMNAPANLLDSADSGHGPGRC